MRSKINDIGKRIRRHPKLEQIYRWGMSHKLYVFLALVFFALFILFTEQVKTLVILTIFGIVATFTIVYKRVIRLPPVLETISITTALVVVFYGLIPGIIYTIVINITSEIASGHPDEMSLTYIPSRTAQVLFMHFAWTSGLITNFVWLGILGVVAFNMVQQPIYMSLVDVEKRLKSLYFVFLNIPLNILLFKLLGPPLFAIMQRIA